jgi:dual specificity tyrosine-phosphorylation-regulated kinase 1
MVDLALVAASLEHCDVGMDIGITPGSCSTDDNTTKTTSDDSTRENRKLRVHASPSKPRENSSNQNPKISIDAPKAQKSGALSAQVPSHPAVTSGGQGGPCRFVPVALSAGAADPNQRQRYQQLLHQQQMAVYVVAQQQAEVERGQGQQPRRRPAASCSGSSAKTTAHGHGSGKPLSQPTPTPTPLEGRVSFNPSGAAAAGPHVAPVVGPRIADLLASLDPTFSVDDQAQEHLFQLIDDFLDKVCQQSLRVASHRGSKVLEASDIQLILAKQWGIVIPGLGPPLPKKPKLTKQPATATMASNISVNTSASGPTDGPSSSSGKHTELAADGPKRKPSAALSHPYSRFGAYYPPQIAAERSGQPQLHHHLQISAGYLQPSPEIPPQPAAIAFPPRIRRPPTERPLIKLSVSLLDTYKNINTAHYEDSDARRTARAKEKKSSQEQVQGAGGTNNNGWDDDNFDYIVTQGEMFYDRYRIKERIGKGSFGQVVRAEDIESHREVAIKIIKSKKRFLMQAKTEIELLTHLWEKDPEDQHNIGTCDPRFTSCCTVTFLTLRSIVSAVRLLTHFMYRNHQCLVFEMLSLNLYELLKNTQFGGVSLNLIRKFGKQVLKALAFLAKSDVDIIHCDLKPENILLRHPKKSGVKVIDFGLSCRSNKRMYSYIQSKFYRSPEVMLGLPYSVAIDMWSVGCILAEMHTGKPLFPGFDQFDQMQKIVKVLGMIPASMLERSRDAFKFQFFERAEISSDQAEWRLRQTKQGISSSGKADASVPKPVIDPSTDPIASLKAVIVAGNRQKKKFPMSETHNSARNYELFLDVLHRMLAYRPEDRIKPEEAMKHPFFV